MAAPYKNPRNPNLISFIYSWELHLRSESCYYVFHLVELIPNSRDVVIVQSASEVNAEFLNLEILQELTMTVYVDCTC